jgi:hypothetical protein
MSLVNNITFNGATAFLEYQTNGPYFSVFSPGAYLFEVWGAQGGCFDECKSAKGGYSRGVLYLSKPTKIFVNVGEHGDCVFKNFTATNESYNGGGKGRNWDLLEYKACAGGGATDIRVKQNTFYHRILVAGGGGGDSYFRSTKFGGYGGGIFGGNGSESNCGSGFGGTQEQGGKGAYDRSYGNFGIGGSVVDWDGGGGGGGWYGGSSGQGCQDSGGGGSGFALTFSTYEIAKKQSKYAVSTDYFLTNTKLISGNETQYGFGFLEVIEGNLGHGKAKITMLHSMKCGSCRHSATLNYFLFFNIFVCLT